MAVSATDISISNTGNIRWTGNATTQYSVLELHRWLGDKADDAQASGDDILDITKATPSERSTDNIITLINSYNIDDTVAQHLYDGSISQDTGNVVYSGIVVSGSFFDATTEIMIIQDNKVLTNYWGTGINTVPADNVLLRCMVKTRTGGTDIDGKKLRVVARELGSVFAEFSFTAGLGNSFPALFASADLNNVTSLATIAGWTTITNVEGYQAIDLLNGAGNRYYYSQWNKAALTINQLYERTKWISSRAPLEDGNTQADQDNALGNGTITRQGNSFSVGSNNVYMRRFRVQLKVGAGSPTGNMTGKLYNVDPVTDGSDEPDGAALATSNIIPADRVTSAYAEYEFVFDTPYELSANTVYCFEVDYTGDGGNYVEIYGNSTDYHPGNRFDHDGSYNADITEDLWFEVYTSFEIHGIPGELFRGITHEIDWDAQSGATFDENEIISWGTGVTAGTGLILADSEAGSDGGQTGTSWIQLLSGVAPTDGMYLTGGTSGTNASVDGSVTSRTLPPAFLGTSTGSAIIGAFGIGIEALDLTSNDKLFDLTNTQQTPPNQVTFTVFGLEIGEDRILVGPKAGGNDFDFAQMALAVTLNTGSETTLEVGASEIPADTNQTGILRVELDTGIIRRIAYSAHNSNNQFTIADESWSDPDDATSGNDVMIAYIDKLATSEDETFQLIYDEDRTLWIRVRDGGTAGDAEPIKTFETSGALGVSGGSATAIRTTDA